MANKPKQKYGLFDKLLLALIGSCELAQNPCIFITRASQHIQESHIHFDETLNIFGPMVFTENKDQNGSYTLKHIFL